MTGSLFDLGLSQAVVGISDYCVVPGEHGSALPRVGGPKNPRVEEILALRPDLVIANQEENSHEPVEALAAAGITVWLTFPTSMQAAINDLWILANLFRSDQAMKQVDFLERSVEWAGQAGVSQPPLRYFCPIWEDRLETGEPWWMTFNAGTYSHDVLRIFNGKNVFANRERRYPLLADLGKAGAEPPGERDTRYPRVRMKEIVDAQPDMILLPSEPYAYTEQSCAEFAHLFSQVPAAVAGRIFAFDGSLITWPGTRLARALEELQPFFSA
jgi:ABC-type Fe3+-hydroxamate transport system substrate-binding protein